jgi:hypothetical protein
MTKLVKKTMAAPSSSPAQAVELVVPAVADTPHLSATDRDNPAKVSGQELRVLAHQKGMARSLLDGMSDHKIREQLRYITQRFIEAA